MDMNQQSSEEIADKATWKLFVRSLYKGESINLKDEPHRLLMEFAINNEGADASVLQWDSESFQQRLKFLRDNASYCSDKCMDDAINGWPAGHSILLKCVGMRREKCLECGEPIDKNPVVPPFYHHPQHEVKPNPDLPSVEIIARNAAHYILHLNMYVDHEFIEPCAHEYTVPASPVIPPETASHLFNLSLSLATRLAESGLMGVGEGMEEMIQKIKDVRGL